MKQRSNYKEHGISLTGLIFILFVVGMLAVLGMKVLPTVTEYMAAKNAIVTAKTVGTTPAEIRSSFDKQADVNLIQSINGKDLDIVKTDTSHDVSFEYQKKISLVGPVSLLIDYEASTAPRGRPKKAQAE